MNTQFQPKHFIIITLITSIWVHAYQLIRFFAFVREELRSFLSMVPNVAPMDNLGTLIIWGAWDTLLAALYVFLFWLCAQVFGNNRKSVLLSGLVSWCFFFVLYWTGTANMNLIGWQTLLMILPLTFLEPLVASMIASTLYSKKWASFDGCVQRLP
jgi:hypothetical protein